MPGVINICILKKSMIFYFLGTRRCKKSNKIVVNYYLRISEIQKHYSMKVENIEKYAVNYCNCYLNIGSKLRIFVFQIFRILDTDTFMANMHANEYSKIPLKSMHIVRSWISHGQSGPVPWAQNFFIMSSKLPLKFLFQHFNLEKLCTHFKLNFSPVSTNQLLDITLHIQHHVLHGT